MKIHHLTASIAAVLLSASLFSCSSDDFFGKAETNTDGISFGVSTENGTSTRANNSADGYTAARYTLRSDNSADTLCVRAVVTDGIGNDNAGRPATRAAMQATMYDKFNVVAQYKKADESINSQLYMNETATRSGLLWSPNSTYYWPEKGQLRFFAWAPTDATLDESPIYPQENVNMTTLKYTASTDLTKQRDLVAAATGFKSNPSNDATCTPVDLQFKHLCTAVIIKTGKTMAEGTIKSVKITNVLNSGTYNMATAAWDLDETTADYTVSPNLATTGATADGTKLNDEDATFMLLPQTLGADSKLEVVFHDNISGNDRPLSASLSGAKWLMGKTVTYRLSITPEYELKFVTEPTLQDAHYVIYPITIKVDNNLKGGWTMKSNSSSVTLRKDLTDLEKLGYWIEDDRGTQTITGTETGELTVYAFLEENIGLEKRNVVLELSPTGYPSAIPAKFTVTQLCPSWITDGLGCERIEDGDYQWGFLWDEGTKITYDLRNVNWFYRGALDLYLILFTNYGKFITRDKWPFPKEITINFNEVESPDVAKSATDGKKNTEELYNYNGVSEAAALMQLLERWGGIPDKTLPTNPTEFAVRAAVMKNKFNKEVKTTADGPIERPVLKAANLVWYLPAKDEYSKIKDYDHPLSGDYWTSTASEVDKDNDHSYKYTEGVGTSLEIRTKKFHVRAVRKKSAERL
ncbi:fimbrillin family protein [Prevotella sp.]|uniref:fimbrillin family protein n=1 Tax=Prevotella sp. TaxID=59823 RepID=UPI0025EAF6B5|nr:fimbrillin family protein [Prevotella sp.]MCI7371382.1 fimbrillin family protein [Prevotella sp.]